MLNQGTLAAHIALKHGPNLGNGHMGFVDDEQEVIGEVVQQAVRGCAASAPVDVAGVVFDAVAEAHLLHHLKVILGAHAQALGFNQFVLGLQLLQAVA